MDHHNTTWQKEMLSKRLRAQAAGRKYWSVVGGEKESIVFTIEQDYIVSAKQEAEKWLAAAKLRNPQEYANYEVVEQNVLSSTDELMREAAAELESFGR